MVPIQSLGEYAIATTLNNSSTTLGTIDDKIILSVLRKYNQKSTTSEVGRYRECRRVSFRDLGIAEEDSGYIEANSIEDPVYYMHNNTLYVLQNLTLLMMLKFLILVFLLFFIVNLLLLIFQNY